MWMSEVRYLHLSLGVDNDTGVVLKVDEDTVSAPPCLALADDDCGVDCICDTSVKSACSTGRSARALVA